MSPGPALVPADMDKPKLTIPTIHLNGTSFAGLYDPLVRAVEDGGKALSALAECAPHGRDYYLQGEDAYAKARDEHLSRVTRLQSVLDELKVVAASAPGAQDARKPR